MPNMPVFTPPQSRAGGPTRSTISHSPRTATVILGPRLAESNRCWPREDADLGDCVHARTGNQEPRCQSPTLKLSPPRKLPAASSRCGTRRRTELSAERLPRPLPMRLGDLEGALAVRVEDKRQGRPSCMICHRCRNYAARGSESWSRKSEQGDKWSFCLTAGTLCPANQERP